ncbi:MAG: dockerin type I domain-containing protein [bacterium]
MRVKNFSLIVFGIIYCGMVQTPVAAFQETVVHASKMRFSRNVTVVDDHVVLWGMGPQRYAWVAYPLSKLNFASFRIDVEVSADTAANRWPKIGVAFNDSSRLFVEETVTSTDWYELSLGQFSPTVNDSVVYLVFTNDYINRRKQQDLNLRIRNVVFHAVTQDSQSVRISWDENNEDFVKGYRIHYGVQPRNYTHHQDVGMTTEKILTLPTGWTYYFTVSAYGPSNRNESEYSDEVTIKLQKSNSLSTGYTERSIDCDIDGNGVIDLSDWLAFRASLNSVSGEPRFNQKADFNGDGKIDDQDQAQASASCGGQWGSSSN